MERKVRGIFCFEVSKEVKLVVDKEGNYHEGYVMGNLKDKFDRNILMSKEDYIKALENYSANFSALLKTSKEYLKPITIKEYVEKIFEDDEELYEEELKEKYLLLKYYEESEEDYLDIINTLKKL